MESDFIELREAVRMASSATNFDIQPRDILRLSLDGGVDLFIKTLNSVSAYKAGFYTLDEVRDYQNAMNIYKEILYKKSEEIEKAYFMKKYHAISHIYRVLLRADPDMKASDPTPEQLEAMRIVEQREKSISDAREVIIKHVFAHVAFMKFKIEENLVMCLPMLKGYGSINEHSNSYLPFTREDIQKQEKLARVELLRGVYKIWSHPNAPSELILRAIKKNTEVLGELTDSEAHPASPWLLIEAEKEVLVTQAAAEHTVLLGISRQSLEQFIASKKAPAVDLDPREVKSLGQVMNVLVQLSGLNLAEPYVAAKQLREDAALLDMLLPESDETLLKWLAIGQTDKPSGRKRTRKKTS